MKRKLREEEDSGTWMNTYSDLVTLLLTFFVLMFSMSSVNADKWEAFVRAFAHPGNDTSQVVITPGETQAGTEPFPSTNVSHNIADSGGDDASAGEMPENFDQLYVYLKDFIEKNGLESSVELSKSGDSVIYIRFQNNIFFDPDKYYLKQSANDILDYVGDCLYNVEEEIYLISINGHTADVGYEDYAVSDWMLSSERASSVAIFLDDEKHMSPQKLRPIGYGKNFPIATNENEEGREKNRRVDITVIKNNESEDGSGLGGWTEEELAGLFDPNKFPKSGGTENILTPEHAMEEESDMLTDTDAENSMESGMESESLPSEPKTEEGTPSDILEQSHAE